MRLDKYLKVSRIIKRRTVAGEACDKKRVSVNGNVAKSGKDLKVGDEIEAKFVTLDRKTRNLGLSIKAVEDEELAEALEEYHQTSSSSGTTSLGELLKEQLDQGN